MIPGRGMTGRRPGGDRAGRRPGRERGRKLGGAGAVTGDGGSLSGGCGSGRGVSLSYQEPDAWCRPGGGEGKRAGGGGGGRALRRAMAASAGRRRRRLRARCGGSWGGGFAVHRAGDCLPRPRAGGADGCAASLRLRERARRSAASHGPAEALRGSAGQRPAGGRVRTRATRVREARGRAGPREQAAGEGPGGRSRHTQRLGYRQTAKSVRVQVHLCDRFAPRSGRGCSSRRVPGAGLGSRW